MSKPLSPDRIAYWYFRLNGFFTIENFILHGDSSTNWQVKTDADILGVRFPFRCEPGFVDDTPFVDQSLSKKPHVIIAEIKRDECKLNGPWSDQTKQNIEYALMAIGYFGKEKVIDIAGILYKDYQYESEDVKIQLVLVGSRRNNEYSDTKKQLVQILFSDILRFIYRRFVGYRMAKKDHQQWDKDLVFTTLWEEAGKARDETRFVDIAMQLIKPGYS